MKTVIAEGRRIIILGPHAWGRGDTEREALKNYKANRYVREKHQVIVIDADKNATVDEMGDVQRPADAAPSREIKRMEVA